MSRVTDADIETFERDGIVLITSAFDANWLDRLEGAVEDVMNNPSPLSREYVQNGEGRFFTDHHMSRRNDIFSDFMLNSPASELAAALLRSDKLNLVDEHLLVKEPGTDAPTYWHHDLPYFEVSWQDFASFWIPLDPVTTDTGAMKFAKGSHKWGKTFKPVMIGSGREAEGAAEFDGPAPDIDADPRKHNVEVFEMDRGDALFFHAATLHAAEPNRSSGMRRRALSLRYGGSRATWEPRDYVPSRPDTPDLIPGGSLDGIDYPVIWRA
ncbi:MAG: phytanoyl-CoA dioxygenase family protein [Pseudomonadota bacterium]|nr:phytanoyl-CoA dioxygenase family protein [Pseudomonadota bacterium]